MTERVHSFTVVLDNDCREDDAQEIKKAILMIKGVLSVSPHLSDADSYMAQERAKSNLEGKVLDAIRNFRYPR